MLEIYWDFSSPFAYLGSTQAEAVAKKHGATLVWRPMLLGGLFRAIGQVDVPLFTWSDAKKKYYYEDMHRWAAYWGVPFKFPTNFPTNSLKAMRAYLALPEADRRPSASAPSTPTGPRTRTSATTPVSEKLIGDAAEACSRARRTRPSKKALVDATRRR